MKILFFIACLLTPTMIANAFQIEAVSYSFERIDRDLKFINEAEMEVYSISDSIFIGFRLNAMDEYTGEWIRELVSYSYDNNREIVEQKFGELDISDNLRTKELLFYRNTELNQEVVIWNKEDEYFTFIDIYWIKDSEIHFVSDLIIGKQREEYDTYHFPVETIGIENRNDTLQIRFPQKTIIRKSDALDINSDQELNEVDGFTINIKPDLNISYCHKDAQ